MENENLAETGQRETREQRKEKELGEKLDALNQLRGIDFDEVMGYVYREVMHGGRQALPPLESIAFDHEIGLLYGPGRYNVLYEVTAADGQKTRRSVRYHIGQEYAPLHRQYCQENGRPCSLDQLQPQRPGLAFGDFLTEEKAKGLIALLGAVKMVLGGRGDDQAETLKFMLDQQQKTLAAVLQSKPAAQAFPESLMTEAFKMLSRRAEPSDSMGGVRNQLELFREMQAIVNPPPVIESREDAGPMEKLIEKALEILPSFLAQHNGNIPQAAAAAKKKNPLLISFLKNKDAQRGAYAGLLKRYGRAEADKWAVSFGLDPSNLAALDVTAQAPAQQQRSAPAGADGVIHL